MTSNELKELMRTQPFEPFKVQMADGSAYEIRHPDALVVGNYTAITTMADGKNGKQDDRFMHLSIKHITRVEKSVPAN